MTLLPGGPPTCSRWAGEVLTPTSWMNHSSKCFFFPFFKKSTEFKLSLFRCGAVTDAGAVGGGYALSPVWHHRAEEGRMWLAALYCLSHWDLLGDQRTTVGSEGESFMALNKKSWRLQYNVYFIVQKVNNMFWFGSQGSRRHQWRMPLQCEWSEMSP